ncbi:MAG: DUF779 domain-containing protein [Methyloversatilis sp.]|jgi:uncharacterized protein (DUF779 family)|nr:DUF779 domain-containing protein [Methyloversatilis sp.]MBP6194767.1 DUF779 domain-containing protein [Methyloversatilis sp.]MBP9118329.1 DUF779 domain-containing protein [Methyloversatilis sp.]
MRSGRASDLLERVPLESSLDAVLLILRLSARYGPLMFRHGEDAGGSQPLCRPVGSIELAENDVKLGEIAGCEYWIAAGALEKLDHDRLVLDVQAASATQPSPAALTDRFVLRPA